MALNSLDVYLVNKAWLSSLEYFHVPETHKYYLEKPNGIEILNLRPILPLGGDVRFIKKTFMALDT